MAQTWSASDNVCSLGHKREPWCQCVADGQCVARATKAASCHPRAGGGRQAIVYGMYWWYMVVLILMYHAQVHVDNVIYNYDNSNDIQHII